MVCAICHIRKARRFCPGERGDICTLCCGTEREVTVDCPFDCQYLQDARKHERSGPVDEKAVPHQDVRVTEEFLEEHEALLAGTANILLKASLDAHGAVDNDVRESLDGLIRTQRTLQSGVFYESVPVNALAARIFRDTRQGLDEFRKQETEKFGMSRTRDSDVLQVLVFLQRLEFDRNNGRPRGRAFIDFLRSFFSHPEEDIQGPAASSLILP